MTLRLTALATALNARLTQPDRPCDAVVGDEDAPYMLRWRLWRKNPLLNAFLHRVLRPDEEDAYHDHPWPSASLVLSGAVIEQFRSPAGVRSRRLEAGSAVFRRARFAHRLSPDPAVSEDTWTLFVMGPKLREWGFHCATGWVHWEDYTALDPDGRRRRCG